MTMITVTPNYPSPPTPVGPGTLVTARPGAGGSLRVEYTNGSAADIANNAALWLDWPSGSVSADAMDIAQDAGFVRCTATAAIGTVEIDESPAATSLARARNDWAGGNLRATMRGARLSASVAGGGAVTFAAAPRISFIGDSQLNNSVTSGFSVTVTPSNVAPGFSDIANFQFQRQFPTGGPATFQIDYANLRARVAANGETYGAWVNIKGGGVFKLFSSGGTFVYIRGRALLYGSGLVQFTVSNIAAANAWHVYGSGSIPGLTQALSGNRLEVAWPTLGIPGDTTGNVADRLDQAIAQGAWMIVSITGTNTLIAQGLTPDQAVAAEAANQARCAAAGCVYVSTSVMPRFGPEGDAGYTLALQQTIVDYNAKLAAAAKKVPNWFVINGDVAADPANNGRARTGATVDGVHMAAGMALAPSRQLVEIIDFLWPPSSTQTRLGSAAGAYNAVSNPTGNLITAGAGSFIGTGGTAGTGVAAAKAWSSGGAVAAEDIVITAAGLAYRVHSGTALGTTAPGHTAGVATNGDALLQYLCAGASVIATPPAGWTFQRSGGTTPIAKFFKVFDADGDSLVFHITSTTDGGTIFGFTSNATSSQFFNGDEINAGCDFDVQGVGCAGVGIKLIPDGAMLTSSGIQAMQCTNIQPFDFTGKVTPAIPPGLIWSTAGLTSAVPLQVFMYPKANAAFLCKVRNAYISKAIPS